MQNVIEKHDRGALTNGKWYGAGSHEGFKTYPTIGIETLERVLGYDVEKKQAHTVDGQPIDKNFYLWREDVKQVIFPSVGDTYHCMQNSELIEYVEKLRADYTNFDIESAVTLSNGQNVIINLNIMDHTVKNDNCATQTRMTITNSFGRHSLTVFLHQMRLSCANMLRMAQAQGEANKTFKKFRHTKTLNERVGEHVFDLADLIGEVREHNTRLDHMAESFISGKEVDLLLEQIFPSEEMKLAGVTKAKNTQRQVRELYDNKSDLVSIPQTRYRLLNAVTDYTSHQMGLRGQVDAGKRFMSSLNGAGDKINQRAFEVLAH